MSDKTNLTVENLNNDLKQFVTNKILNTEKFNSCFKEIAMSESRLVRLKNLINESVLNAFLDECSQIFVEAKLAEKFEILKTLKPSPDFNWRPPGDPIAQLRSVRAKCKRRQLEELRVLVKVKSDRISKLKRKITPFLESADSFATKQQEVEKLIASSQAVALNNRKIIKDLHSELAESFELLFGYK